MNGPNSATVRLAHFSDVHVTAAACVWRLPDWFSKRLSSWVNLRLLGRGKHFRHADEILAALRAEVGRRNFDHLVFSGDATALGFEEEVERAADLLGVGATGTPPGLAVPGNHDYCTRAAAVGGHFERHFAPWQGGERLDGQVYPFAQRVGPAWLVGVNSATVNHWPTDARGRVGAAQLERLERLLDRLEGDGPRILVTHYPVWVASGRPEKLGHGLRDLDDLLSVARHGGVSLWLHGHRHDAYHHLASERVPFPIICAGSATQHGRWSYGDYTLTGWRLRAVQRVYEGGGFRDGRTFEVELPRGAACGLA
jgi:3',5'-cyclic AMP phosphodiesterase CpdA